jgi:hypothetical protein
LHNTSTNLAALKICRIPLKEDAVAVSVAAVEAVADVVENAAEATVVAAVVDSASVAVASVAVEVSTIAAVAAAVVVAMTVELDKALNRTCLFVTELHLPQEVTGDHQPCLLASTCRSALQLFRCGTS